MSFRNFGGSRSRRQGRSRGSLGTIVTSVKNEVNSVQAVVAATNLVLDIAIAQDAATTAVANDVQKGCLIKAIWIEFWYYGLSAGATNDIFDAYLMKNPGNNLTNPNPGTTGTSNEKKFVIREWKGLAGLKSLGGQPYNQRGRWFKLPKRMHRMGTDDRWVLVVRSPTTGNFCSKFIYKWYT